MISPATRITMPSQVRSRQYMEAFVSVEKAGQLQDLSMQRFQVEAAKDIKLGRMLGHISVNRRSTEIVKTATFEDDIIAELERESAYDEDAALCDIAVQQTMATPSLPQPKLFPDTVETLNTDDWTQLPLLMNQLVSANSMHMDLDMCEKGQTSRSNMTAKSVDNDLLIAMDEDWMYDFLSLQMGYDAFADPKVATALQKSVTIQVWKMILESLTGFAKRKSEMESANNVRQLEAYGSTKGDMLVGLGLQCGPNPYDQFNARPQVAT